MSIRFPCPFFKSYYLIFLLLSCMNFSYILDLNPLSDIWFAHIIPHSVRCPFILFVLLFFFFAFFCLFVFTFYAAPVAYGSSQARGWIRATAASLHHSQNSTSSKLCLRPAFSFCWWFPWQCRSFLVWCSPTCLFLLLFPLLLVSNPENYRQDWCQGTYHLGFFLKVLWLWALSSNLFFVELQYYISFRWTT